jgi:serine protease inhibitor
MKQFLLILLILPIAACVGQTFQASGQQKEPAQLSTDIQAVVQGNNEFAFDLYARLAWIPMLPLAPNKLGGGWAC